MSAGPGSSTPRLSIVGLGAVGGAFARLALERELSVQAWTRSWERAELWRQQHGLTVHEDLEALARDGELLLLCVGDGALPEIVERLTPLAPRVVAHVAGALGPEALAPLGEAGWAIGACHPARPIPSVRPETLRGAALTLAGDGRALPALRSLADALGLPSMELSAEGDARARYHAACALLSNGVVGLAAEAERLLTPLADPPAGAEAVVRSLLGGALENLSAARPAEVLTGPVRRGDVGLVESHLRSLDPDQRALYAEVSAALLRLVGDELEPARRAALERLLDRERRGAAPE
ncbi:MAG: DUF2520 domain-containing protein [Planctomycetota bacterium]